MSNDSRFMLSRGDSDGLSPRSLRLSLDPLAYSRFCQKGGGGQSSQFATSRSIVGQYQSIDSTTKRSTINSINQQVGRSASPSLIAHLVVSIGLLFITFFRRLAALIAVAVCGSTVLRNCANSRVGRSSTASSTKLTGESSGVGATLSSSPEEISSARMRQQWW